jgi:hypothetical protein
VVRLIHVFQISDSPFAWYGSGFPQQLQLSAPLKPHEEQMLRQLGYLPEPP